MDGLKPWLINRVTITLAIIIIIVVSWNAYVRAHNDGVLEGEVVTETGEPVPDATVILNEQTLVSLAPIAETTTDASGRFSFLKHDRHKVVLTAEKDGVGSSERVLVRLYFRNQNRVIEAPITLNPER